MTNTTKTAKTTFRIEFTVERRGNATRKAIEGTNLDRLMARVEKLDGYNVVVLAGAYA